MSATAAIITAFDEHVMVAIERAVVKSFTNVAKRERALALFRAVRTLARRPTYVFAPVPGTSRDWYVGTDVDVQVMRFRSVDYPSLARLVLVAGGTSLDLRELGIEREPAAVRNGLRRVASRLRRVCPPLWRAIRGIEVTADGYLRHSGDETVCEAYAPVSRGDALLD